jgi:hypothetical protein
MELQSQSHQDILEAKRKYKQQWREKNKDKISEYQRNYLQEHNEFKYCDICKLNYKKYNKNIHIDSKQHKNSVVIETMRAQIAKLETMVNNQAS